MNIVGKLLRSFYYKKGRAYRVPLGVNRGVRLRYQSEMDLHAMTGLWEQETCRALRDSLQPGMCVLDVGANVGFMTMLAARRVGPGGKVFAFEPAPWPRNVLEDHLSLNGCTNVEVVPAAVSDHVGEIDLHLGDHHHQSSLFRSWAHAPSGPEHKSIRVTTLTVDRFVEERSLKPDFIKMDIEGGGVLALKGIHYTALVHKPTVLIELHNPEEDHALSEFLLQHGYVARRVAPNRGAISNIGATWPDPDGVWGTVLAHHPGQTSS